MYKIEFGNIYLQSPAFQSEVTAMKSSVKNKNSTNSEHPFKKMIDGIDNKIQNSSESLREELVDKNQLTNGEDAMYVVVKEEEVADASSQIVAEYLIASDETTEEITEETTEQTLTPLLDQVLDKTSISEEWLPNLQVNDLSQIELELDQELSGELSMQITMSLSQLKQLLTQDTSSESVEKVARDLHKIFHLWSQLSYDQKQQFFSELEVEAEEEELLLRHLISLFEKRNSFAKQRVYQMSSSITQEDVQKWLQQSLEKFSLVDHERPSVNVTHAPLLQMSHLQQYTLHVTEADRIDAISRNLASDLSNIINRSSFLKQAGLEELTLTLRPHSLGDVTIRLAQINGEMTVRFLVTTEAARKLFEANLHQLKPMFAPNQVVVERDMTIADDDFFQEEQEQLEEENKQEENDKQAMSEDTNDNEVSFDEVLQFLSEEANE